MVPFQYLKIVNDTVCEHKFIVFHMNGKHLIRSPSCFDFATAFGSLHSVIPGYFLSGTIYTQTVASPKPSSELEIDSRIHLDVW